MGTDPKIEVVRERPGCVLGISLGFLVLGSIVAWIWLPKGERRDGALLFQQWFGATQLPADFEISDAGKLIGGEEVLQLHHSKAAPERALAVVPKPRKPNTAAALVDWAQLEQGAIDQLPHSLTFVHYPKERAQRELGRLFSEKLQVGRLDEIGSRGGRMLLEVGTIPWGEQFPACVIEREFEPGGTFRDFARIDLSTTDDALIVNAAWARSEPLSKPRLQSLLASLRRP